MSSQPVMAVLGAGGFLGRWLAAMAAEEGYAVHAAVRDVEGARRTMGHWGVTAAIGSLDVREPRALAAWIARARPDAVVNAVGYGVDPGERSDQVAHAVNAVFPVIAVEAVAAAQQVTGAPIALLHLGTAAEYGVAGGDLAEGGPMAPISAYGRSKLAGTLALSDAAGRLGVRALTGRLFTVFGAGEHAPRLLPTLRRATRHAGPVPLTAGTQRRDFGYVEDVARMLVRLARSPFAPGDVVNVASGRLHAVREFAELAAGEFGIAPWRLDFGALPTRADEMWHDAVRVDRLRQLAGEVLPGDLPGAVRRAVADPRWEKA